MLWLGPGADVMLFDREGGEWQAIIEVLAGVGLDAVPAWRVPGMRATGTKSHESRDVRTRNTLEKN